MGLKQMLVKNGFNFLRYEMDCSETRFFFRKIKLHWNALRRSSNFPNNTNLASCTGRYTSICPKNTYISTCILNPLKWLNLIEILMQFGGNFAFISDQGKIHLPRAQATILLLIKRHDICMFICCHFTDTTTLTLSCYKRKMVECF